MAIAAPSPPSVHPSLLPAQFHPQTTPPAPSSTLPGLVGLVGPISGAAALLSFVAMCAKWPPTELCLEKTGPAESSLWW